MKEKLTCHVDQEGTVWLTFNASTGKSATINVHALSNSIHAPITAQALDDWCLDRVLEHRRGEVAI